MQCGTCISPGDFQLVERDMPQTAPEGWVLLDVSSIGLCGTDFHIFEGKHPFLNYPRVIGHEIGAVVAESAAGWNKGDTVVVNPYLYCGECRACQRGKPNCCSNIEVLGVHRDGGMCGRLAVPATNLYSAEGLTLTEAAMV
jgi:threonine dehydrogenase-like Zn-dependent dehydrogenase